MKKLLTILTALLLAVAAAPAQDYQAPPVQVSHDRVSVDGKLYYAHVVVEKQTLFSISKAYKVPLSDIYEANRNLDLEKYGLKAGQVLLIPIISRPAPETQAEAVPEDGQESGSGIGSFLKNLFPKLFKDSEEEQLPDSVRRDSSLFRPDIPDTIRVAVIMPFTKSKHSGNSIDFYSGQLLAARLFGIEGNKLEMRAYDLNDTTSHYQDSLGRYDIIFGPISGEDVKRCLDICPEDKCMVSPLDPKADTLARSHFMVHTPTPARIQNDDVLKWLREDMKPGDAIVLLTSSRGTSKASKAIADSLAASGMTYSTINYSILQGRTIRNSFMAHLSKKGTTRFVLASEDESFMNDAVRNVSLLAYGKQDVALYANSKLRSYSTIETEHLHNAHCFVSSAYYTDYSAPQTRDFVMSYRSVYGVEPNSFAIHGYDAMRYFLNICRTYGRQWPQMLTEYKQEGLQTGFDFVRYPDGKGFVNQAVRRLEFLSDYTIELK